MTAGDDKALQVMLLVEVDEEADPEEVEGVAQQLRQELGELPFVEAVDSVEQGQRLGGMKGVDGLLVGAMVVSFLAGAAPALAAALYHWQQRGDNRLVKVQAQVGDRAVKLELPAGAMTAEQLQQVVNTILGAAVEAQRAKSEEREEGDAIEWVRLGRLLDAHFDVGELTLVCAELGIEWENLVGERRVEKAYALVAFCGRSGRLEELVEVVRRERPAVVWELGMGGG
jgi:predicted RNA polymerase sigma factor